MKDNFNNTSSSEHGQTAAAQHDSILGCMFFDAFCGGALGALMTEAMDIPQWAADLDVDSAMDLYEEYRQDRTNGGFELGVNGALNGMFNDLGITFKDQKPGFSPLLPASDIAARGQGSYITAPAAALSLN